jgi:predicted ABC-type transport system involved in lysophospholipase L1 biosynthesis ATPase subunit
MVILKVEKIAQSDGALRVLPDISFNLQAGDRIALIAQTGQGRPSYSMLSAGYAL